MNTFEDFNIKKQLRNAIDELGYENPTPIQEASYSPILGGFDFVGIAQTGTGKTMAYLLPIVQDLKFSDQPFARVLILAPTRELVIQIVEQVEKLTPFMSVRVTGVFGGTNNISSQTRSITQGVDIIVGTPRRLYDLVLNNVIKLKSIKKLVIDEVDIMLDFGYKTQLNHIFEHLPQKRQNILFSATMTTYVDDLISDFLVNPKRETISISGTPLDTISQSSYSVPNFYSKVNLLKHLLDDNNEFRKVLIFVATKVSADRLKESLEFGSQTSVIHSGKEQNHRTASIEKFEANESRILIATDVIARGIDMAKVSHVISFDTPFYAENYIHRIGRTGRAGEQGKSILLFNEKEEELKAAIESLMNYQIPFNEFPSSVKFSRKLTPEEEDKPDEEEEVDLKRPNFEVGASFHEKSAKNSKEKTVKLTYEKKLKEKFKKPIRRGDKIQNMASKKRKKK
jgi:ATP-dependent RNA helicase RhlE